MERIELAHQKPAAAANFSVGFVYHHSGLMEQGCSCTLPKTYENNA